MILHIKEARYVKDFILWVRFNDGSQGEIDLREYLTGEVFEQLNDEKYFKDFTVDEVMETIVWSNGADIAPEFLYENMKVLA